VKINTFKILSIIFFLSFSVTIEAQNNGLVRFDVLAQKMERVYRVKLYYNLEWFENRLFQENLTDLPLEECLNIVKRRTELDCLNIQPGTYIFAPAEIQNYSNSTNINGVLLIGELGTHSSATVSGKISDIYTGKPLKGAIVRVEDLNESSITDKDGRYELTIPVGKHSLTLNYAGFEEDQREINVFGNGIVNFEMAEKTIKLKEVVVADKAANLNVISSQMSTIKLNSKTIKELPLFLGVKDIMKGIKLLPGITSTGEFGSGFFVRGGGQDQNLILIEEVPLFNSAHIFGLISALNSDGINNVTLLKSGIPSKYGERVSSVMDIRMGTNPEKIAFKGGIGLMDTRLNFEMPLLNKKASLLIGARTSYSNWLLHKMPDVDLKNSSVSFYDINALFSIKFNPQNKLTLYGYYSDDKYSLSNVYQYHYDNLLGSVQYTHQFNEKFQSTVVVGMSRYRNDMCESDTLEPTSAYKVRSSILYNNAKLDFSWQAHPKNQVNFGLNAVLYNLQPGIMTPYNVLSTVESKFVQKEKGMEMAAYISDNLTLSSRLSAEFGLRFNTYANLGPNNVFVFSPNAARTTGNITDTLTYGNNKIVNWYTMLEPRLSMRFSLDDFSSVKLSYNRMSQFINLISNSTVMSPTDVYKLCSPNVKPVICDQVAFGFFRNFNRNAFEASVELYYKKLQNILEYRDGAELIMNKALEADLLNASGYNYGVEFYLKKNTGRLTGWASYTYSRSMRHTTSPYAADQINQNRYFRSSGDQPHSIVMVGNYHITRRWSVSGTFNYSTGRPVTLPEQKYQYNGKQYIYYSDRNEYRLPDYHRLDVAVTHDETLRLKQPWKGSWTFSILNLYAQKNPYSVFYKATSNVETKFYQKFNLYKMYIIEKPIPTMTYNFTF
jgi:hypothetical protein